MTDSQLSQLLLAVTNSELATGINTQYLLVIGMILTFALGFIGGNQR